MTPSSPPPPASFPRLRYPETRVADAKDTLHGVEVRDPYRWLEDASAPAVQAWTKEQDRLARAELERLPERDAVAARLKELFYIDAVSIPQRRNGRYFYTRRHATKEKSVVYWRQGKDGPENVLLDPNQWSADGSLSLGGWQVSSDGKAVAYQVRKNNSDQATLHVIDVETGQKSDIDVIEGANYATASWTPEGDGFYYTWLPTDPAIPAADRPGHAEVRFHKLGESPKNDRVIRGKTGDPTLFMRADISRDGHFLLLHLFHGWASMDVYFRDTRGAGAERGEFTPLVVGQPSRYNVHVFRDKLYVHTNDGASRFRVFEVDPALPDRARWKEIIPEQPDATLDTIAIIGGRLALSYIKAAASRLEVRDIDGRAARDVPLPSLGTIGGPTGLPDEDEAYFSFESYTAPMEIYSMSMKTGETELYARANIPVDASPFMIEQVFYRSKDGTRVSMFIVRRRDFEKDGSARALLYGYGGFGTAETPVFVASIYTWLERGGIYAAPNIRGGNEYGEEWHRAGMRLYKQNVFDDFIAAAEHLIEEGYTRPERLAIEGASGGGLLVGASLTQRPDLFGAVLCSGPVLDMIRYPLFGAGKMWILEYGSPDEPAEFGALHAYSPYHHVKPGTAYPAVLLSSADTDDRVDAMHAKKFAAALQAASSGGPVLLRMEQNAGHGGADLIKATVQHRADQLAFALAHTSGPSRARAT